MLGQALQPRPGKPSGKAYCWEVMRPKERFAAFRAKKTCRGKGKKQVCHVLTLGCRKRHWNAEEQRCDEPMRAQRLGHSWNCPKIVGKCKRAPDFKTKGYPLEGLGSLKIAGSALADSPPCAHWCSDPRRWAGSCASGFRAASGVGVMKKRLPRGLGAVELTGPDAVRVGDRVRIRSDAGGTDPECDAAWLAAMVDMCGEEFTVGTGDIRLNRSKSIQRKGYFFCPSWLDLVERGRGSRPALFQVGDKVRIKSDPQAHAQGIWIPRKIYGRDAVVRRVLSHLYEIVVEGSAGSRRYSVYESQIEPRRKAVLKATTSIKVGDWVRILPGAKYESCARQLGWVSTMDRMLGNVYEVIEAGVKGWPDLGTVYVVQAFEDRWLLCESQVAKVSDRSRSEAGGQKEAKPATDSKKKVASKAREIKEAVERGVPTPMPRWTDPVSQALSKLKESVKKAGGWVRVRRGAKKLVEADPALRWSLHHERMIGKVVRVEGYVAHRSSFLVEDESGERAEFPINAVVPVKKPPIYVLDRERVRVLDIRTGAGSVSYRTIREIEKHINARLIKKFSCGSFGCTALTEDGNVVKFTSDISEVVAANAIIKGKLPRDVFPKIFKTFAVCPRGGDYTGCEGSTVYVIYREDVHDLPHDLDDKLGSCGMQQGYRSGGSFERKMCSAMKSDRKWRRFAHGIDDLLERDKDVKINDLRSPNLGITRDGRIVIRDLGFSRYGKSAAPFLGELSTAPLITRKRAITAAVAGVVVLGGIALLSYKRKPSGPRNVMCIGDSLTAANAYQRHLRLMLPAGTVISSSGTVGKGAAWIEQHLHDTTPPVGVTDVIVLAGVNDLAGGTGGAAAELLKLESLWQAVKAMYPGARLIAVELTPWAGHPRYNPDTDLLNRLVRSSSLPDVVVKTGALGDSHRTLLPQYSRDGLHMTDAGYQKLAELIAKEAF